MFIYTYIHTHIYRERDSIYIYSQPAIVSSSRPTRLPYGNRRNRRQAVWHGAHGDRSIYVYTCIHIYMYMYIYTYMYMYTYTSIYINTYI